jgi:predicted phosphoribosyltransferase
MHRFENRSEAGRALAEHLLHHRGQPGVLVLGLPRGGVPVAAEVARALGAPLDVFLVRKLGLPGYEELAMGAISSKGVRILNEDVIAAHDVSEAEIEAAAQRELRRIEHQEAIFRLDAPPLELHDRRAILVDDGVATGATVRAAAKAARLQGAATVVVAAPVGSRGARRHLLAEGVDEVVFALEPEPFGAVGAWYDDFGPVSDDEVRRLLVRAGITDPHSAAYPPAE